MRLARIQSKGAESAPVLLALASGAELDLLQLDYVPDRLAASAAFMEHFHALHKHLFLEPNLRLITNAGGGDVVACIETLGSYLREHGSESLLITAVRGDNLLPRLHVLANTGVELVDEATGRPLALLGQELLSAQVELGAGPYATAWEEGSRVIVGGCYDPTAPFIAASKAELETQWTDFDSLAQIAAAYHAAAFAECVVELDAALTPLLDFNAIPRPPLDLANELRTAGLTPHADVNCDFSKLALRDVGLGMQAIEGARGTEPGETWRVRLTFRSGDVVDSPSQARVHWCRVPRDMVPVSVDTRPAAEWF